MNFLISLPVLTEQQNEIYKIFLNFQLDFKKIQEEIIQEKNKMQNKFASKNTIHVNRHKNFTDHQTCS